ncbi:MAG TPA: hypothetical protein VHN82_04545, partial [Methanoregula sp.]|nr:hypothetical protein [Methanoregula sp.]
LWQPRRTLSSRQHRHPGLRAVRVVTSFFTIDFTIGGVRQTMQGRDMFFLVKEGKNWLVAADQFSPEPPVS